MIIAVAACIFIFFLLEWWRPCYFLTDDNLSAGLPVLTEMGRNMQAGHLPFTSSYLFGGNYSYVRDMDTLIWHPLIMLAALLADTVGRFWMMEVIALCLLVLATSGFTLLACRLREEMSLPIPDGYIVFYSLSFVFSSYVLTVGSSWLNFLGNLSALPWLAYAILDRKVTRATFLICLFSIHEVLIGYAALMVTSGLFMTLFAFGVGRWRHDKGPFFSWLAGNTLAISFLLPLLLIVLVGFSHSNRILGLPFNSLSEHSIPSGTFLFSFFLGNWSEPFAKMAGDRALETLSFPFVSSILACAAAWCVIPALCIQARWRPPEKVCAVLAGLLFIWIIRPDWLAVTMYHLPFFHSMRWSFREGMLFLFFIHILLILRFPARVPLVQGVISVISAALFLLPLPFIRVPTLNLLAMDRQFLFSGEAGRFWDSLKTEMKPTDSIATVIDLSYFRAYDGKIPYTLLGTANFPAYFKVRCVSGYSPTAPTDQIGVKTVPEMWFGAFLAEQVPQLVAEKPDIKIFRIRRMHPLEITMSTGAGPEVDLTPELRAAGIIGAAGAPIDPAAH